ncbi:hypothetical protein ACGF3J_37550 [Streptomyces sp. NPDC048171]|uniref:hypothetical protein n=1 Tax=Streptomyces sp. NPDC048171 TaxID=3365504 RepID=UPI0037157908
MDGEIAAALVAGASGFAGAVLGAVGVMWAARRQEQAALKTALLAYLAPLETARRSAQRDVFVAFLANSQDWARTAEAAVEAARRWDAAVRAEVEECLSEPRAYTGVSAELRQHCRRIIDRCGPTQRLTEAVQHVLLEAATTNVASAAQNVEQHAIRLASLLDDAGNTRLESDRHLPADPSNNAPPNPERSPNQLRALQEAIEAFTVAAAAHLNNRRAGNGSDASN